MKYIKRILDGESDKRKEAFNAINRIGLKGCELLKKETKQLLYFKMKKKEIVQFFDELYERNEGIIFAIPISK